MNRCPTRRWQFLAAWVLAFACATGAQAPLSSESRVKVRLLAEESSIQPGHTVSVGILFDLAKGWHIYWVNPGDSGRALQVQWTLPKGFQGGEIRWPVPTRIGVGTGIEYGYEGRVLLPVLFKVPPDHPPGTAVRIVAHLRYMICREGVCMMIDAQPGLSLPSADRLTSDAEETHRLFEQAREHEPKPMPATWKAQVFDDGTNFVLTLQTGTQTPTATFFPLVADQVENAARQTVAATSNGIQITLKKAAQLSLVPRPASTLKGVVVLGSDRAYEIAARLASQ